MLGGEHVGVRVAAAGDFGIAYDEGCTESDRADNPSGASLEPICPAVADRTNKKFERLLVTYLQTGEIALINAAVEKPTSTQQVMPAETVVLDLRGGFFPADSAGRRGTFAVAPKEPGSCFFSGGTPPAA